jgi:hypothetical protein
MPEKSDSPRIPKERFISLLDRHQLCWYIFCNNKAALTYILEHSSALVYA